MEHIAHKPGTLVCWANARLEPTKKIYKVHPERLLKDTSLDFIWSHGSDLDDIQLFSDDPVMVLRMEPGRDLPSITTCLALHPEHGPIIFKLHKYPHEVLTPAAMEES